MAAYGVEIIRGKELANWLLKLSKEQPQKMWRMLQWTGIRAVELTKKKLDGVSPGFVLHRITGTLWGSIDKEIEWVGSDITAEVYSTCEYAPVHEFGLTVTNAWGRGITFQMPKREFMRPSVQEAVDTAIAKLESDWWKL